MTKTAIAALALRLADEGRLDLDAPEPGAPYTLRQLLRHTAGLPDYGALPAYRRAVEAGETPWSDRTVLRRTRAHRLLFAPDGGWRYSNVGYLLARRRLEERTGHALGDALAGLLLRPLGLRATRLAETARDMADLLLPPPFPYHPGWVFHGTLIGPVREAALFLHRLLEPGFLSADGLAALLSSHRLADGEAGPPWHAPGYGLGAMTGEWRTQAGLCVGVVGHGAAGPGSRGATFRLAKGARSVTVCAVCAEPGPDPQLGVLEAARPHL
ncbi:class A beta-lactamase-related serine hydrolase [Aureimonas flava]|uniref:Class A beta-lactamase-related serine hydrolase n=1 Tax=Aureimonas flava TaxID=2320271 RepID=A0A3A1WK03_9HYPH|nr:serine hydrolase domain-containing protein [Aureimonas flava]RIX99210.1 class A beta-lactamase-related serine hydrolase [Aureimonas flava]